MEVLSRLALHFLSKLKQKPLVNNLSTLIEGSILIHINAQHFTDILF